MSYCRQPGHYPPGRVTSLAIAALITAVLCAPVGIVLGVVARKQIRRTGEEGWGVATAGLVVGVVLTALWAPAFVLWVVPVVWL